MKKLVFITLFLLLSVFIDQSLAVEVTLFGPNQYLRTTGKPNVYSDTFPGIVGQGKLILKNGTQGGQNRISSAVIKINGNQVLRPRDFNQQVYDIETPINLAESNSISIELRSGPGAYLTVRIVQEVAADGAAVIGPEGGSIMTPSGSSIAIPPGALAEAKLIALRNLTQSELPISPPPGVSSLGAVDIKPDGILFNSPATLTLPLLSIFAPDVPLPVVTYDPVNNFYDLGAEGIVNNEGISISSNINHTSVWSVFFRPVNQNEQLRRKTEIIEIISNFLDKYRDTCFFEKGVLKLGDIQFVRDRIMDDDVQVFIDPELLNWMKAEAAYVGFQFILDIDRINDFPFLKFFFSKWYSNDLILPDEPYAMFQKDPTGAPKTLYHEMMHAIFANHLSELKQVGVPNDESITWYMEDSDAYIGIALEPADTESRKGASCNADSINRYLNSFVSATMDAIKHPTEGSPIPYTEQDPNHSAALTLVKALTGFDVDPLRIRDFYETNPCEKCGSPPPPPPVGEGLVAYYQFENNANDMSGNENHGTLSGGVAFVEGVSGTTVKFGGYTNPGFIYIPNSQSLQFDKTMSIAFWASIDDTAGIIGSGAGSLNGTHCFFAKDHDRTGFFGLGDFSGWLFGAGGPVPNDRVGKLYAGFGNGTFLNWNVNILNEVPGYSIGQWIHIAYVITANEVQMFLNGILIRSEAASTDFTVANGRDLYIGKFSDFWYPLNGAIDEFRIYNRALAASEIQTLVQNYSGQPYGIVLVGGLSSPNFLTVDKDSVYWTETVQKVRKVALNGGQVTTLDCNLWGGAPATGITVDSVSIYWALTPGYGTGGIYKVPINGTCDHVLELTYSANQPRDIAVDSDHLYWSESNCGPYGSNAIRKIPKNGGGMEALTTTGTCHGTMTTDDTFVYFEHGTDAWRIGKVPKSGGDLIYLAIAESWPSGIAIDGAYVYWVEPDTGNVKRAPINGGMAITLATGVNYPYRIVVDADNVYFTEYANRAAGVGAIKKVSKSGGGVVTMASGLNGPYDIAIDNNYIYWTEQGTDGTDGTIKKIPK